MRKDTGGLDAAGHGCLFSGEIPIYLGQFVSGLYHGYGVLSQEGERYEGQFCNNRYHGKGHLISATYDYVGEFKDGKKARAGGFDVQITK